LDQIGPLDGSSLQEAVTSNQYFEESLQAFDVGVLENFTIEKEETLASFEIVIDGWNGFESPTLITMVEVNIYSESGVAEVSLTGDIASQVVPASKIFISTEWYGSGYLISVPVDIQLSSGSYWFSVIPTSAYESNGQIGVVATTIGDGIPGMQANPNEGLGFGKIRKLGYESAYRIHNNITVDPCSVPFKACPEDIDGDGFVSVLDLLEIIAAWGSCGDGTFRPSADCAPFPNGDCCVNIADVLAVVGAWDAECAPHGACCLPEGVCMDSRTEQSCLLSGGVYFGQFSECAEQACYSGACCLDEVNCIEGSQYECDSNGGFFKGDSSMCADVDCAALIDGDECFNAFVALEGENPFDTIVMTPSDPQPDESQCQDSNLIWAEGADVWFEFTPTESAPFLFTLCDSTSYDTSMVLYEGNCSTQVACNGDGVLDKACQPYYSEIEYDVTMNETYFVRIGGWHGDVGSGTLTVEQLPPPSPGACCFVGGVCIEFLPNECDAFDGTFEGSNTLCEDADCIILEGDDCDEAVQVEVGTTSFSTEYATPSEPIPSDTMCVGTYLEWGTNNPDIWLRWDATDSGVATFTTCDESSFDTSLVLYRESCENQIACNGDSEPSSLCQNYYSEITYNVVDGATYFIRIGGWQGTSGEGTLTITLDGDNSVAACCLQGECYEAQLEEECLAIDGDWQEGETCSTFNCADILCHSSSFAQTPHGPNENWFAGNSSIDASQSVQFNRTEYVNVQASSTVTVWGLQAHFNGAQWSQCNEDYLFTIRSYADKGGFPGSVTRESLQTPSLKTGTGTLYAGVYELVQWEFEFNDSNIEHIGIQSESDGLNCWFLWLSSGEGDYSSSVNSGNGWTSEVYDLSICIDE